jgi:hypothetical protein
MSILIYGIAEGKSRVALNWLHAKKVAETLGTTVTAVTILTQMFLN